MSIRVKLSKVIRLVTVGKHSAIVHEIQHTPERRFEGTVEVQHTGVICACSWNEYGASVFSDRGFDIDMGAPIAHVLRWHLKNG